MRVPRPSRVWALTRRELAQELKGRRWISVPGLLVALLLPASTLPTGTGSFRRNLRVGGDVPEEVAALEGVDVVADRIALLFDASDPARLRVSGPLLPKEVRDTLDTLHPEGRVVVERRIPPARLPHRGLLLAMLAASGLTASIASSIGTERSRRTLGTLLSASITPLEIVLGKLVAWGGLATVGTLLFTAVALFRGLLDPGWWLLSVAVAPSATVALGLWSVRYAPDVVSATTTALRVMPVIAMGGGIAAAAVGTLDPFFGALVPLGGVICTAGEMWTQNPARDTLLAVGSTLLATAVLVGHTAHTLTETPPSTPPGVGWNAVPLPAGLMLLTTACTFVAPTLWGLAGNAQVTASVTPSHSAWVSAAVLATAALAMALRQPRGPLMVQPAPDGRGALAVLAGAAALLLAQPVIGLVADGPSLLGVVAGAMHTGLVPRVDWAAATALIVTEEVLFRGILAPRIGHGPAAAAWALGKIPLDPVAALLCGAVMGTVGRRGGPLATILVRWAWYAATLV